MVSDDRHSTVNTMALSLMPTSSQRARAVYAHDAFCARQAQRIQYQLASASARYQRRVAEHVRDAELHVIDRGTPQAWHRHGQEPT